MASRAELMKKAKGLGISSKLIRSAESAAELQTLIEEHTNGTKSKAKAKSVVKKAVKKTTKKTTAKTKKSASKSAPAAKSTKGKAKRATAAKSKAKAKVSTAEGKRNMLEGVNFSETDGWNPREGSVPDVIVRALRKAKGNRAKAFDILEDDLDELVPKKTRNGRTRDKQERIKHLHFLISRNAWMFALATGQHEIAEGRAEYGTAGTGDGKFKRGKSKSKAKAEPKKATGKKRGRPPGSKNKPKDAKAAGRKAAKKKAKK